MKFFIEQGMKITKIHKAISFKIDNIFVNYIDHNSKKRAETKDELLRDIYKLLNNSLFGKTCQNVRKYLNFRIAHNQQTHENLIAKPEWKGSYYFTESCIGHLLAPQIIYLNKPIYIGQAVLDESKLIMYKFRYQTLANIATRENIKIEIVGGDTDSFFIQTNVPIYKTLIPLLGNCFDASNFPKHHELYSMKNASKLGCVKVLVNHSKDGFS